MAVMARSLPTSEAKHGDYAVKMVVNSNEAKMSRESRHAATPVRVHAPTEVNGYGAALIAVVATAEEWMPDIASQSREAC